VSTSDEERKGEEVMTEVVGSEMNAEVEEVKTLVDRLNDTFVLIEVEVGEALETVTVMEEAEVICDEITETSAISFGDDSLEEDVVVWFADKTGMLLTLTPWRGMTCPGIAETMLLPRPKQRRRYFFIRGACWVVA